MDAALTLIPQGRLPASRPSRNGSSGFTMLELIIIIGIVVVLAAVLLPGLSVQKARQKAKATRLACYNNEKLIAFALSIYARDNRDKLPDNSRDSGGPSWPWDVPWKAGAITGANWLPWYCPGSGFSEKDNLALWNYCPGNYRVSGYAMTFADTATLARTNWNRSTDPRPGFISIGYIPPPPHDIVLLADLTISQPGQIDENNRAANSYLGIAGAYSKPFRTAHLEGQLPLGGNVAMLDGHAEWRMFPNMRVRTVGTTSPVFWW